MSNATPLHVIRLTTLDAIHAVVTNDKTLHTVWARCQNITQDWRVFPGGYRLNAAGQIEINFGEWDQTFPTPGSVKYTYLNEEWRVADLVYALHPCSGCGYPPDMCCLAGTDDWPDEDVENYMAEREYIPIDGIPDVITLPAR